MTSEERLRRILQALQTSQLSDNEIIRRCGICERTFYRVKLHGWVPEPSIISRMEQELELTLPRPRSLS